MCSEHACDAREAGRVGAAQQVLDNADAAFDLFSLAAETTALLLATIGIARLAVATTATTTVAVAIAATTLGLLALA